MQEVPFRANNPRMNLYQPPTHYQSLLLLTPKKKVSSLEPDPATSTLRSDAPSRSKEPASLCSPP